MFYTNPTQGKGGPGIGDGAAGINPLYKPCTVSRWFVNADINLPQITFPIGALAAGWLNALYNSTSNGDGVPPVNTVTPDIGNIYPGGGGNGLH